MNSMKIKKTLIKLLPYIIVGLVCTNLGEAWRLAEGADMGKKMLSFFSFEKKYPINSMYLIDNYFGGETASAARERSAERDNTTCFCGGAGTAEGFGKAIVLNPGEGASEDAAAAVFRAHGFTRNGNRYEKMQ